MKTHATDQVRLMLRAAQSYPAITVESTLFAFISTTFSQSATRISNDSTFGNINNRLYLAFSEICTSVGIETIIDFFEAFHTTEEISQNGIVFTPKFIAEYITDSSLGSLDTLQDCKVIDPACGAGIFLVAAAEYIHARTSLNYVEIINRHIFGIDRDPDIIRRCGIVLKIFVLLKGEDPNMLSPNLKCLDSLQNNWDEIFNVNGFDCIVGNPPYVNPHDMCNETASFLKSNFETTASGVFNIFYAFIEQGLKFLTPDGRLSFIIPNNFLFIKSAKALRSFLTKNGAVEHIIDFTENMIFRPVRTYNCIIQLSATPNSQLKYAIVGKTLDIEAELSKLTFHKIPTERLDSNGWILTHSSVNENIRQIEAHPTPIGSLIRTGIATLRDNIFTVNCDDAGFFKSIDGARHPIESELIKRLYKIPEINKIGTSSGFRNIIFPYEYRDGTFHIIPENVLRESYPLTYEYLCSQRNELDRRDKGKGNKVAWYAYGRSQGLNNYGKKILFPTFADNPKFTPVDDEDALFCNGYGVFVEDAPQMELLAKILNSNIMKYYVQNTSYQIEGGYFCYQKKYIEKFSIPNFTDQERTEFLNMNQEEANSFLANKYGLSI